MASQYSVQQMLALTDDALVQFLFKNRDGRGMFDISGVSDWGRVAETEHRKLLERIAAVGPLAKADRSLDFSKLVEKLSEISPRRDVPTVPSSPPAPERLATLSPEPGISKERQTRCYHWLVEEGGKPLCSLETLNEIYENPDAYKELLVPWLEGAPASSVYDLGLFSRQLNIWRDFRRWQRSNRGLRIFPEDGFAAFLEEQRRDMESMGLGEITARSDFETTIQHMWERERDVRDLQWRRRREIPNGTFAEYAEAARLRVARHGFTQQFDLREDAEAQDDRVTWIEYLEFECWTLDQLTISVPPKEGQPGDTGRTKSSKYERNKKRESSQQLRVQWVLSNMPADPEAVQSAAAARGKVAKTPRGAQKRKRPGENRPVDSATDEVVKRPTKKQKMGSQRAETAGRKGASRMLLGLDTPVATTRVGNTEGGTRRSARIKRLEDATETSRS